jgi:hypothetical protein
MHIGAALHKLEQDHRHILSDGGQILQGILVDRARRSSVYIGKMLNLVLPLFVLNVLTKCFSDLTACITVIAEPHYLVPE